MPEDEREEARLWEKVASPDGDTKVDALLQLSYNAAGQHEYTEALAFCETARETYEALGALASNIKMAHIYFGIGHCLRNLNRSADAAIALSKSVELYQQIGSEDAVHILNEEGDAWYEAKEYQKSFNAYRRAIEDSNPDTCDSIVARNYVDAGTALEKLKDCEKIFKERLSGTNLNRPQFKKMMDFLREGDVLYVTKLDRLARNTKDLLNIKHLLEQKMVKLVVMDQGIDTTTPVGNLLFGMLSVYAEFENDLRKENQRDGIITARNKGVTFGRRKAVSDEQFLEIKKMRNDGFLIKEIMEKYKISKATTYRVLSMQKEITLE